MLGLYLHIPFCSSICNYCNFNRGLFDAALKARMSMRSSGRSCGRDRRAGRHDLLRWRHAVAPRPDEIGADRRLPAAFDGSTGRRSHARDQSRDLAPSPNGRVSRGRRQPGEFRCPVVSGRRAATPRPAALGRSRVRARWRGARGRVRQHQPRPDDVAAGAVGERLAGERRAR